MARATFEGKAAQCTVWSAYSPGWQSQGGSFAPTIPLDFLAALDFWSMPRFEDIRLVRFGDGVPLETRWEFGMSESVVWKSETEGKEEKEKSQTPWDVEIPKVRSEEDTRSEEKSQEAPSDQSQVWLRVQRARWADETDTEEEEEEEEEEAVKPSQCFLF